MCAREDDCDKFMVTPEMIEAGIHEMAGYSEDFEGLPSLLERVFLAMIKRWERRLS